MKIRKASKKDLKEIVKLMSSEFSKKPFNEKSNLSSVLKSLNFYFKLGEIYVVVLDKKIAGVLVFKLEQYWEGKVLIIGDLAIEESFKNKGVGTKLMNFVESYAKKNKIRRILFTTNKQSKAVNFYKKIGYSIDKLRIEMEKVLK